MLCARWAQAPAVEAQFVRPPNSAPSADALPLYTPCARNALLSLHAPTDRTEAAGWRSAFLHGVASKELGDASGNRPWALHVQQVSHAFNPAVLDLWEPGVE